MFWKAFGCGRMGILDRIDVLLVIVRSFYRVGAQVHIVLTLDNKQYISFIKYQI